MISDERAAELTASFRQPRQSFDTEQVVLGSIMVAAAAKDGSEIIEAILAILAEYGPENFYRPGHATIYREMLRAREKGVALDAYNLIGFMKPETLVQIGGGPVLHTCIAKVPLAIYGLQSARELSNLTKLRQGTTTALRALQRLDATSAYDADETISTIKGEFDALGSTVSSTTLHTWSEVADDVVQVTERLADVDVVDENAPIPSPWPELNDLLGGGFRPGEVVIWAGRPGTGKSVAGLCVARYTAMKLGLPFLWFSLEMSALDCGQRILSAGASVAHSALRSGALDDEQWGRLGRYCGETRDAPLAVDDAETMTMDRIDAVTGAYARQILAADARAGREPRRLAGIGIDYLQLVTPGPASIREQQVSQMSRAGKMMARRRQTTLHMLAQFNRGPDQRPDGVPKLSDLRESGSIEQDADVVIGLHRPDMYDRDSPRAGELDFHVLKCRNGETGVASVAAQLHLQRLTSMRVE